MVMKSEIEIFVQFDYRGETLTPSTTIDLDQQMEKHGHLIPTFYPLLAKENGIDRYSYEFEVMESLPISVRRATGLAEQFVEEGVFDQCGFEARWREMKERELIEAVALKHVDREILEQCPKWREVLFEVYQLGKGQM